MSILKVVRIKKIRLLINRMKVWYAPNQFEAYGEEEIKAVEASLRAGWLAGFGPRTVEFETKVSALFGKKHGLFVNSGSSAILLALCVLDLHSSVWVRHHCCTNSAGGGHSCIL